MFHAAMHSAQLLCCHVFFLFIFFYTVGISNVCKIAKPEPQYWHPCGAIPQPGAREYHQYKIVNHL